MKKKLFCLLAAALLAAGLAGCGGEKSYIAPASFTTEEQNLLALLGIDENRFFDYRLEGNLEGMTFRIYRLEEGQWTPVIDAGGVSGFLEEPYSGRMAILFESIPEGVEVVVGGARFASAGMEGQPSGNAVGLVTLDEKKTIGGETEIPLALQIFAENAIWTHTVEDFDHPEELAKKNYLAVYAITVVFCEGSLS